ncbi:DUF5331 domain-containing protein [Leptolyngbya sp. FACHB-261]|uniref:DUF5331 domain-containing protein n=1 Tax=Leptolyngbya sp. FACHB-261 TaxID=2692806 RepID=UPI0016889670|nr:DUF5331 domain-containing protein [Leptolyngbya sp. FACHB-261]MBD2102704.1 hypothetical protein [Leptolyngbya sp. FACHB-261]
MNAEKLCQDVKAKWLAYYQDNRSWITKLQIWSTYDGQRRPSSGFILAVVGSLEPHLAQSLPIVVQFSNNPDRIVSALGLNFNPDVELQRLAKVRQNGTRTGEARLLPSLGAEGSRVEGQTLKELPAGDRDAVPHSASPRADEACRGVTRGSA